MASLIYSMVPVIAIGCDDLRDRIDAQNQQATEHTKKLANLISRLEALTTAISNSTRLLGKTNADRPSVVDVRAAFAFVDSFG